jgi:hypothetical protein
MQIPSHRPGIGVYEVSLCKLGLVAGYPIADTGDRLQRVETRIWTKRVRAVACSRLPPGNDVPDRSTRKWSFNTRYCHQT